MTEAVRQDGDDISRAVGGTQDPARAQTSAPGPGHDVAQDPLRDLTGVAASLRWARPDLTTSLAAHALDVTSPRDPQWAAALGWRVHGIAAVGDGRAAVAQAVEAVRRRGATLAGPAALRLVVEVASASLANGDLGVAWRLAQRALDTSRAPADLRLDALLVLAQCASAQGADADGLGRLLDAARAAAAEVGGPVPAAAVGWLEATVAHEAQDSGRALDAAVGALELLQVRSSGALTPAPTEAVAPALADAVAAHQISALLGLGRAREARQAAEAAVGANRPDRATRQRAELCLAVARAAEDEETARRALAEAAECAAAVDAPGLEGACRIAAAELAERTGTLDVALREMRAGRAAEQRDQDRGRRHREVVAEFEALLAATPAEPVGSAAVAGAGALSWSADPHAAAPAPTSAAPAARTADALAADPPVTDPLATDPPATDARSAAAATSEAVAAGSEASLRGLSAIDALLQGLDSAQGTDTIASRESGRASDDLLGTARSDGGTDLDSGADVGDGLGGTDTGSGHRRSRRAERSSAGPASSAPSSAPSSSAQSLSAQSSSGQSLSARSSGQSSGQSLEGTSAAGSSAEQSGGAAGPGRGTSSYGALLGDALISELRASGRWSDDGRAEAWPRLARDRGTDALGLPLDLDVEPGGDAGPLDGSDRSGTATLGGAGSHRSSDVDSEVDEESFAERPAGEQSIADERAGTPSDRDGSGSHEENPSSAAAAAAEGLLPSDSGTGARAAGVRGGRAARRRAAEERERAAVARERAAAEGRLLDDGDPLALGSARLGVAKVGGADEAAGADGADAELGRTRAGRAEPGRARAGGTEAGGAGESRAEAGGAERGGADLGGAEAGGTEAGAAESGGARRGAAALPVNGSTNLAASDDDHDVHESPDEWLRQALAALDRVWGGADGDRPSAGPAGSGGSAGSAGSAGSGGSAGSVGSGGSAGSAGSAESAGSGRGGRRRREEARAGREETTAPLGVGEDVGPLGRAAERRAAERRALEERRAERRAAETRAAETRAAEIRAAETRATGRRAAEDRAVEDRAEARGVEDRVAASWDALTGDGHSAASEAAAEVGAARDAGRGAARDGGTASPASRHRAEPDPTAVGASVVIDLVEGTRRLRTPQAERLLRELTDRMRVHLPRRGRLRAEDPTSLQVDLPGRDRAESAAWMHPVLRDLATEVSVAVAHERMAVEHGASVLLRGTVYDTDGERGVQVVQEIPGLEGARPARGRRETAAESGERTEPARRNGRTDAERARLEDLGVRPGGGRRRRRHTTGSDQGTDGADEVDRADETSDPAETAGTTGSTGADGPTETVEASAIAGTSRAAGVTETAGATGTARSTRSAGAAGSAAASPTAAASAGAVAAGTGGRDAGAGGRDGGAGAAGSPGVAGEDEAEEKLGLGDLLAGAMAAYRSL